MAIRRISLYFIISTLFLSLLLSACTNKRIIDKQSEYHPIIYDLEEYLLNTYGEYYCIDEPIIDYDNRIIRVYCNFLTSYVESAEREMTILEIMEGTRLSVNSFLSDNSGFFLNDGYIIKIFFLEYSNSYSLPPVEWGMISNELYDDYNPEPTLCYAKYPELLTLYSNDNVSFEGIREINLDNLYNVDINEVIMILSNMPDLEIVRVRPEDIQEELSQRRPDLLFV